jgi:hypothetical protein
MLKLQSKCLTLAEDKGEITLTATAEGLKEGSVKIIIK